MALAGKYVYGSTYKEYQDTGNEDYSFSDSSVRRVFDLYDWAGRIGFIQDLMGYGTGAIGGILREPPEPLPQSPLFRCVGATVEGIGKPGISADNTSATFDIARITAIYKSLDFDVPHQTIVTTNEYTQGFYMTRSFNPTAQYLTLQGVMQFVSRTGTKAIQTPPGKLVCQMELVITHRQVPGTFAHIPNDDKIAACQGKVNSQTFERIPAGGVLYLGCTPKVSRPSLAGAQPYYDMEHRFLLMNNGAKLPTDVTDGCSGHNYIFDTLNNRFDLLTTTGDVGGTRLYQQANLLTLFE